MKYRLLSILLALTLVLSLLPGDVWAADSERNISGVLYAKEGNNWTVKGYEGDNISGELVIVGKIDNEAVTKIAAKAFARTSIESVIIPNTVTEIGVEAFSGCTSLEEASISENISKIEDSAFSFTGLKGIVIPGNVSTIGEDAFAGCEKLETVVIRQEVGASIEIKDNAFMKCSNLKYVFLPLTVNVIGKAIFLSDENLVNIHCSGTKNSWRSQDNNRKTKEFFDLYEYITIQTEEKPEKVNRIHLGSKATTKPAEKVTTCSEEIPYAHEEDLIVCGYDDTCPNVSRVNRIVPRLDHKPTDTAAVDATCTTPGAEKGSKCSECGKVLLIGKEIPALGHTYKESNWTEKKVLQESVCESGTPEVAIKIRLCDVETCKEPVAYSEEELQKDIETILKAAEKKVEKTEGGEPETIYESKEETFSHKIKNTDGKTIELDVYTLTVTPSSHTPGDIVKIEKGNATQDYDCAVGGKGYKVTYTCKTCGKEFVENNVELEAGKHVRGEGATSEVVTAPTCSKVGKMKITSICPVCNKKFVEDVDIEKLDHTPGEEEVTATTATCYTPGVETIVVKCTVCDEVISTKQREVTESHKFEEDTSKREEPTCTKVGKKVLECTVCHKIEEHEIPMVEHTYGEETVDKSKEKATCTEDGVIITVKTCKVCGHEDKEEEVVEEAPGHKPLAPEKVEVKKAATCTEEGSAVYHTSCKVCKQDLQDTEVPIPALGHDFGPWTTSGSTRTRTCKREGCGYTETDSSTTPSEPSDPSDPTNPSTPTNTYYSVDVIRPANGSISVSTSSARADTRVTVTLRPNSGYQLDSVWVTRTGSGRNVALSGNGTNRYTFIMPASRVEVRAVFSSVSGSSTSTNTTPPNDRNTNPTKNIVINIPQISSASTPAGSRVFVDVPSTFWAQGEIAWACQRGFISGSGGNFYPNNPITVRQLWMVMARMMGQNPANMEEARVWALNNGFADGGNPNAALTRLQLATMLYRCARLMGSKNTNTTNLGSFSDSRNIPAAAKNAMAWAVANGIITGTTDGRLNPSGTVSRAQFCVILYRYYQRLF